MDNLSLKDGDELRIYSSDIFDFEKAVTIEGDIMNPGTYTYKEDMGLADLILEAGGFKKDTYNVKYEIARIDPNNNKEEVYSEIISGFMDNSRLTFSDQIQNKKGVFKTIRHCYD